MYVSRAVIIHRCRVHARALENRCGGRVVYLAMMGVSPRVNEREREREREKERKGILF